MINILIVEDESIIAEELRRIITGLGYRVTAVVHRYSRAIEALRQEKPDLVLLDIGLDYSENDGIDIGTYIKETVQIPFIYITSNTDSKTVARAKITEPAAYIPKPFNRDIIYANIEVALHKQVSETTSHLTIKQGNKKILIGYKEIVFLKADNIYTEIHTNQNKVYVVREYLRNFLQTIDKVFIVQIHRSYAVNINFVESYNAEHVFIPSQKLPISSSFKNKFTGSV